MKKHSSRPLFFQSICCFLVLLFSIHAPAAETSSQGTLVKTAQGQVQGTTEENILVWKGIRYAKAPVGDLRFRDPQAPDSWTGIKDATTFGAVAPQFKKILIGNEVQSEDCLFLNVWSPACGW